MRTCSALLIIVSYVASGCADPDENADEILINLALVPDGRINRSEEVFRDVESVAVVIDSPDGLFPPGSERVVGDFEIKDDDGDASSLELVAVVLISDGNVPPMRLQRETLPDVPLDVSVFGVPNRVGAGAPVAAGGAEGLRFAGAASEEISIPFNLLPQTLPPRVMETSIADAYALVPCNTANIWLTFSKTVDVESTDERGWIKGAGTTYVAFGQIVKVSISNAPDAIVVHIPPDLTDLEGIPLDQIAEVEGNQPFRQSIDFNCLKGAQPLLCGAHDPETDVVGEWCPGPKGRFTCADSQCVPSSCGSVVCPTGYVCDSATALCDVDCRLYASSVSCPADRPTCDSETGACVAVPS